MSTDLTDLNDEPELTEPIAPVTSDPADLQAEPETEKPVAPVLLTPHSPFLHLHVHPKHLNTFPGDSSG